MHTGVTPSGSASGSAGSPSTPSLGPGSPWGCGSPRALPAEAFADVRAAPQENVAGHLDGFIHAMKDKSKGSFFIPKPVPAPRGISLTAQHDLNTLLKQDVFASARVGFRAAAGWTAGGDEDDEAPSDAEWDD